MGSSDVTLGMNSSGDFLEFHFFRRLKVYDLIGNVLWTSLRFQVAGVYFCIVAYWKTKCRVATPCSEQTGDSIHLCLNCFPVSLRWVTDPGAFSVHLNALTETSISNLNVIVDPAGVHRSCAAWTNRLAWRKTAKIQLVGWPSVLFCGSQEWMWSAGCSPKRA